MNQFKPPLDHVKSDKPTRGNPELIQSDDSVRTLFKIPRSDGSVTAMYEYGRYFNEDGTEMVVMKGVSLEKGPDGSVGYPDKAFSRERLEAIKEEARVHMGAALARLAAIRGGVAPVSEEAKQTVLEFDNNGLIKVPDWNKQSEQLPPEDRPEASPKTLEQELHDTFWAKQAAVLGEIDFAIERAGYIDPAVLSNKIAQSVETVRQLKGLHPDMVEYLGKVIDLCHEVSAAGNNQRSEYHHNARSGLQKIKSMVAAIK